MSKTPAELHRRWHDAEAAYTVLAKPFLADPKKHAIRKRDLVAMVDLRGTADRARESYYRATHSD